MEAKGQSLKVLFDTEILEVPFFQRSYVWTKSNWEELLSDLIEAKISHFLGSIIIKAKPHQSWQPRRNVIIDGQQRLTTLSILIKALYDCMKDRQKVLFDDAKDILFYKEKSSDSEYKISIHHSFHDKLQFEEVVGKVEDGKITSPILEKLEEIKIDSDTNVLLIKRCYKYFYEKLSEIYKEEPIVLVNLWDSLLDRTNNILVCIDLGENDNEQKIFDSINSAGMRLSASDTIKNTLYQKLIELSKNEETVIEYYKNTWETTFECDESTREYWNKTKSVGRASYQNSEFLLRSVAIIRGIFDYKEHHTMEQLSNLYKKDVANKNEDEVKALIEDIISYANIYKERLPNFKSSDSFEFDNVEMRLLKILDVAEINVFHPYILYIFKNFEKDANKLKLKFTKLEKLIMKRMITGFNNKNYNKSIVDIIEDDTKIEQFANEVDSEMIRKALATKVTNKLGTILLFWVELHRRSKGKKYDTKSLQYNFQLEHIMPQKWEENWSNVKYVDKDYKKLPSNEKSKQMRNEKVSSIGNMTLLNGSLNKAVSNSGFREKIEGSKDKKGLKHFATLSITREDIVENVYDRERGWNEAEIARREKILIDEIIDIWG